MPRDERPDTIRKGQHLHAAKENFAAIVKEKKPDDSAIKAAMQSVRDVSAELIESLSQDAQPCQNQRLIPVTANGVPTGEFELAVCNERPLCTSKTPAIFDPVRGSEITTVYEVSCLFCPPTLVEHPQGKAVRLNGKVVKVKRRVFTVRDTDPQEAIRKWNAGELLEDDFLDRTPDETPELVGEGEVE